MAKEKGVRIAIIVLSVLLFFSVSTIVFFMSPFRYKLFSSLDKEASVSKNEKINLVDVSFLALPEIVTNLKTQKGKSVLVKANFILELKASKDKEQIDHIKPLIVDQFQTYLRELDVSDIQGSAGIERIRQELFDRVNAILRPINVEIRNVLFKEFLIQ